MQSYSGDDGGRCRVSLVMERGAELVVMEGGAESWQ